MDKVVMFGAGKNGRNCFYNPWKKFEIIAVLDIDSPILQRFDEADEIGLSKLTTILENSWNLAKLKMSI